MSESLNNAILFLITAVFDLYLTILVIRLILAWSRANYFNPMTRLIIQMTQPIIAPLRRIIPNYANMESSTLVFIIFLTIMKITLISYLYTNLPNLTSLLLAGFFQTIKLILQTFFYAIIFQAILSWIRPDPSPLSQVLEQLTSPILRPLRRIIPPISGFDITPIPALILLQFLIILYKN